jgi:anti-anti-sigma regulatory factor
VRTRGDHRSITIDLHDVVRADTEALDLLRAFSDALRARHGRLVLISQGELP